MGRLVVRLENRGMLVSQSMTGLCNMRAESVGGTMGGGTSGFPRGCYFDLRLSRGRRLIRGFRQLRDLGCSAIIPGTFARQKLCVLTAVLGNPETATAAFTVVRSFFGLEALMQGMGVVTARCSRRGEGDLMRHDKRLLGRLLASRNSVARARSSVRLGLCTLGVGHAMGEAGGKWVLLFYTMVESVGSGFVVFQTGCGGVVGQVFRIGVTKNACLFLVLLATIVMFTF